jgi:hypothetical protein
MKMRGAVPDGAPKRLPASGGGCFPQGSLVATPSGYVPIENIREGDSILSVDLSQAPSVICTKVLRVHTLRVVQCVKLDNAHILTPSQPICVPEGRFVAAQLIEPGSAVMTSDLERKVIRDVDVLDGYFEVYNLTTNHPSHNYIVDGLVCHNKTWG